MQQPKAGWAVAFACVVAIAEPSAGAKLRLGGDAVTPAAAASSTRRREPEARERPRPVAVSLRPGQQA